MATTANRSYRYPTSTDDVRPYEDIQFLASDVDTDVQALYRPGWTSYVPALTTTGTPPSLGNGTAFGRYRRSGTGDLIIVQGIITLGSTSTIGTGVLNVSLPVAGSASSLNFVVSGTAQIFDSGTIRRSGVCLFSTTTTLSFAGNSGDVTHTWQTWNTGDFLQWCIEYEPA